MPLDIPHAEIFSMFCSFRDVNPMMRRVAHQDTKNDFSFAWSLIHEMGAVAAGNATLQAPVHINTMWSMPPVNLTEKERRTNAATILSLICESPVLEPYLKPLLSAKYVCIGSADVMNSEPQYVRCIVYHADIAAYIVAYMYIVFFHGYGIAYFMCFLHRHKMIIVFLWLPPFCLLSRELSFMLHSIMSNMMM